MTPRERYDLQIAATIFGIMGAVILVWALWSGGWSKSDKRHYEKDLDITDKINIKIKELNFDSIRSRGLFVRCNSLSHIEMFSNRDPDDVTCCSNYSRDDFIHRSSWTRLGVIQYIGELSAALGGVFAILLFVSMCHMGAASRQNVRWAALAFGIASFVLSTVTAALYQDWSSSISRRDPKKFPKASTDIGFGTYTVATVYVGLATILIGCSTHKAQTK